MNKTVYMAAPTGMLGHKIYETLSQNGYDVFTFGRKQSKITCDLSKDYQFIDQIKFKEGAYFINCAGLIPQKTKDHSSETYKLVNVDLPIFLSNLCFTKKLKFIHISSDCVFSGWRGGYNERETDVNYDDSYSLSKLETDQKITNGLVLRTSLIGPEINDNKSGLYEWFNNTTLYPILGYINWYWNGLTTKEFSKVILKIIEKDLYDNRLYHIYSPNIFSKYQILQEFNKKRALIAQKYIEPHLYKQTMNRTLRSIWPEFNNQFNIQDLYKQIKEIG